MTNITSRTYSKSAANNLIAQGIHPKLASIYASRGILIADEFDLSLAKMLPYATMSSIRLAAKLLHGAIKLQKKLLIIADFDADGATACAVGIRGLRQFGAKVDYLVPNRFEFGYGLTPEIVELAAQLKPDILITVDNGIASLEGVAEANRLGITVLVTDHHLPGYLIPEAACIVNPNQPGCNFPSKNLAGVGVIFYVLMALRAEMRSESCFGEQKEPNLANLLDLVALGTVSDVVNLDHNNRILVKQGLERIRCGRACAGIRALTAVSRKNMENLSTQDLGFSLAPRLNAAGRLSDMRVGIECLLTEDITIATKLAEELDDLNRERRAIEREMRESATELLNNFTITADFYAIEEAKTLTGSGSKPYSVSLFDPTWHQGVIGILASRLKDKFHRPTIVFAASGNDELKGSGRSIDGFHLRDALDLVSKRHPGLIRKFGGHAAAAGLTIHRNSLSDFSTAFERVAFELLDDADLSIKIETDGEVGPDELNLEFAERLHAEVWGHGFPAPLFRARAKVVSQRVIGEKHLKLKLGLYDKVYDAVLFGQDQYLPGNVDVAYSLDVNEYNGTRKLQLIVRHWEESGE